MTRTEASRVAEARRWFRLLGADPIAARGATIGKKRDLPDVWDANFILAEHDATPTDVRAALAMHFAGSRWQVVSVDALTPPAIEPALALAGFAERTTLIEMLATNAVPSRHPLPAIALQPVADDAARAILIDLIRADHHEGKRTGTVDEAIGEGLLATMLARSPPCRFDLIIAHDEPVGYGLTVACPNRLGLIEHLFTLPKFRGQGVMSAFIVAAVDRLRAAGCDGVFLDAHAADTSKRLYAALGFAPVSIARTWVRDTAQSPI